VWMPTEDGVYTLELAGEAPVLTGPVETATRQSNRAAVAGGLLAVITEEGRLVTVDVSAATPAPAAVTDVSICADCIGIDVVGETLFASDIVGGLRIVDLVDLAPLGRGKPDGFVVFEDVAVAGDHAYVADWSFGLRIFDVSDRAAPVEIGRLETGGYPSSVAYADGHAYIVESTNGGALRVIDVRDPTRPVQVGAMPTSKGLDIEIVDRLAFIADGSLATAGGLRIVDIADPSAPRVVGEYTGCSEVMDVAVAGTRAVVACSYDGFHVLDVSDPASPTQLGRWTPSSPNAAEAVALDGTRAYLGHSAGVVVADLTDPTRPAIGAEYPTAWTVRALHAPAPGRIVASCGLAGVYQWQLDVD
jgi:hypothetical protein